MFPKLSPEAALATLAASGEDYVVPFRHGTMEVGVYRPVKVDTQSPHTRDELYVVISGTGTFVVGSERRAFGSGDVLFAAAGVGHRFEDFTDDFATWVFFWGPPGGEVPA
jgi:mannose-6-phosphate isomerase-like protein (cupin superfamily)